MTMVVNSLLNRIIETGDYDDPASILKELNILLRKTLKQDTKEATTNDGLDMGLCHVDRTAREMHFAGAKIPLYFRDDDEIQQIAGDRQCIGYPSSGEDFDYTNHKVPLPNGRTFYLTTDGYIDQPGGERGFCFAQSRFRRALNEVGSESLENQLSHLIDVLAEYQGEQVRRDDVTVLGFRV